MFHLIPPPLHRLVLRIGYQVRRRLRTMLKLPLRGVSLIGRNSRGQVMLVRHSYGSGEWALPGGGCGRNEDPDEAIRREIREELAVELVDLELLVAMEETISGAPHTAYVFAAQLSGEPVRDGREIIAAQFFDLDALPSPLSIFAERRLAYWQGRAAAGAL